MGKHAALHTVGVIGAGTFGTAIANLLAQRADEVLVFTRHTEKADRINRERRLHGLTLPDNIRMTTDRAELTERCTLIYPIVPSVSFRAMMRTFASHLRPYHILIHGTKGFDLTMPPEADNNFRVGRKHIHTMSEVITRESVVIRVGCLAGPNLASEIIEGQPTATVIASRFDEVVRLGQESLSTGNFHVFGTRELLGAQLAGALKNSIAIGTGMLYGRGYGKNLQALLINRGLNEIITIGKAMGASPRAFLGTAGIGDLVCTATSKKSRNFTFGTRLGEGEPVAEIRKTMPELAEGVRTLQFVRYLTRHYDIPTPIHEMLYRVIYDGIDIDVAIKFLMRYPYRVDVDFI